MSHLQSDIQITMYRAVIMADANYKFFRVEHETFDLYEYKKFVKNYKKINK